MWASAGMSSGPARRGLSVPVSGSRRRYAKPPAATLLNRSCGRRTAFAVPAAAGMPIFVDATLLRAEEGRIVLVSHLTLGLGLARKRQLSCRRYDGSTRVVEHDYSDPDRMSDCAAFCSACSSMGIAAFGGRPATRSR